MKTLDKIIVSPTPPDNTNVAWFDGKNIKLPNKGKWKGIGGEGSGGESAPMMIEVTWEELVALRDAANLIAGQKYRIIDYETVTGKENTQSAGHPFDIIVTALDNKTLDEKASAIWSERDTDGYFAKSNLPAWDVRYCLDNDTSRFDWAIKKGKYLTIDFSSMGGSGVQQASLDGTFEYEGTLYYKWVGIIVDGLECYILTLTDNPVAGDNAVVYLVSYAMGQPGVPINSVSEISDNGKGVIYSMLDENGNRAPYDFKNIMFYGWESYALTAGKYYYTFSVETSEGSIDTSLGNRCSNNRLESGCWNIILVGFDNHNNSLGYNCSSVILKGSNNTFGANCRDIHLENICSSCRFGNDCNTIFFKKCKNITCGNNCSRLLSYESCENISFGDNCSNVEFVESVNKHISQYCKNIIVDSDCCNYSIVTGGTNYTKYLQNVHVKAFKPAYTGSNYEKIDCPVLSESENYSRTIAKNSAGEIKVYCEADLVQ